MQLDYQNSQTLQMGRMTKAVIGGVKDRRKQLQHLARSHLLAEHNHLWNYAEGVVLDGNAGKVQELLEDACVGIPSALEVDDVGAIYHVVSSDYMTLNVAEHLWESGFRDVNFSNPSHRAPLYFMFQSGLTRDTGVSPEEYITRQTDLALWLRSMSGFNEDDSSSMDLPCALAANLGMVIRAAELLSRPHRDPNPYQIGELKLPCRTRAFISNVFESGTSADHGLCLCACCADGCLPLDRCVRGFLFYRRYPDETWLRDSSTTGVKLLGDMLSISSTLWTELTPLAIRAILFEWLEMTHTCCELRRGLRRELRWYGTSLHSKSQETSSEIRKEHAESIERFETILPGVVAEYWASGMDLVSWLDGPLGKRVDEILATEKVTDEEYREDVFKRTGVRLMTPEEDSIVTAMNTNRDVLE
ncbi:hypothetical protein LTR37_014318 [Vermiconidia calcicola]|uniref:Uncharacterized protein n=1 Tax=Vermiconidia calcicola TaxID=1690605 RepID=A0ACC3MVC3_9PEZI|nr:hypothetical protein LTR37_014318 [Vermiconidia calcicola]